MLSQDTQPKHTGHLEQLDKTLQIQVLQWEQTNNKVITMVAYRRDLDISNVGKYLYVKD